MKQKAHRDTQKWALKVILLIQEEEGEKKGGVFKVKTKKWQNVQQANVAIKQSVFDYAL